MVEGAQIRMWAMSVAHSWMNGSSTLRKVQDWPYIHLHTLHHLFWTMPSLPFPLCLLTQPLEMLLIKLYNPSIGAAIAYPFLVNNVAISWVNFTYSVNLLTVTRPFVKMFVWLHWYQWKKVMVCWVLLCVCMCVFAWTNNASFVGSFIKTWC